MYRACIYSSLVLNIKFEVSHLRAPTSQRTAVTVTKRKSRMKKKKLYLKKTETFSSVALAVCPSDKWTIIVASTPPPSLRKSRYRYSCCCHRRPLSSEVSEHQIYWHNTIGVGSWVDAPRERFFFFFTIVARMRISMCIR